MCAPKLWLKYSAVIIWSSAPVPPSVLQAIMRLRIGHAAMA